MASESTAGEPEAAGTEPGALPDRRADYRQRTYLGGLMITDEAATVTCVIRNLSPDGAMIQVSSEDGVPDSWLLIDIKNGVGYHAKTVWREAARAGVRFVDRCDLAGDVPPAWRYIKSLWSNLG